MHGIFIFIRDLNQAFSQRTPKYETPSFLDNCVPYSQQACKDVSNKLGLKLGHSNHAFAADYDIKGCYAYASGSYAGHVFYGTGGTRKEMKDPHQEYRTILYRPIGYDCNTSGMEFILPRKHNLQYLN